MILYLDTSALVKLYVREKSSQEAKDFVQRAEVVATSQLAYVEARAAFARKSRESGLSPEEYRSIIEGLHQDWESYFAVDLSHDLVRAAGQLVDNHPLRASDAIHLASGVFLRDHLNRPVTFSCFDRRLASAAEKEGLELAK